MSRVLLGLALLASTSVSAIAAPIVLFDSVLVADAGAAAPLGSDPLLAGPGGFGGGLVTGDVGLVAPAAGTLTIAVQDLGLVGDVFEVLLDGRSLGTTAPVAVGGPVNSAGSFTALVGPGFFTVGAFDFVLTSLGTTSPFGGLVDPGLTPSELRLTVALDVPEPASLGLLSAGLALGAAVRRRQRPASSPSPSTNQESAA